MKHRPTAGRRRTTKSILRLLDLEHAKSAVLNSLSSLDAQRGYRHAIDEFVDWYCSEPRLALNRTVVLRYRSHLESRQLAPGPVNLSLGVACRLAYGPALFVREAGKARSSRAREEGPRRTVMSLPTETRTPASALVDRNCCYRGNQRKPLF